MEKHQTKLIDGNFTPETAREMMQELLKQNINFYGIEKYKNQFHYGDDQQQFDQVINQLTQEREQLMQWLNNLGDKEQIKIHCYITMEKIA